MTKNLFLVRHGEANPMEKDQRDFYRKLSGLGENQASLLGEYLAKSGHKLDVICASASSRTVETARLIASQLKPKPRLIPVEEYYEATKNVMVAAISQLEDLFHTVMIVGHNPSVTLLLEYLTHETVGSFTPASCAWVQFDCNSWKEIIKGTGSLKDYYYPGKVVL